MATPEEKARAAAIMRELISGKKVVEPTLLQEPNRSFLYFAVFAVIAVGLTIGISYYFGAWDEVIPYNPAQHTNAPVVAKQLPPLTPSTLPPAAVRTQPAKQPNTVYQTRPRSKPPATTTRSTTAQTHSSSSTSVVEADRTREHEMAARARVAKEGGFVRRIESVEQVTGWTGRYRTTGEATFYKYSGSTPTPKRFEVLTQETDRQITDVDFTIKW